MSGFAPITAVLLARKGDAVPSQPVKQPFVWKPDIAPAPALSDNPPPRQHRVTVTLSPAEYQALGIAAVKKDVTRHRIVRDALERHLARLALEYGSCACIGVGRDNSGKV